MGGSFMTGSHICIVRHGETDWNKNGILQGWLDVPINALGQRQAHALAVSLVGIGFSTVWCSPLARARETAEIVARQWRLAPPLQHAGLKEKNFGAVQGVPKEELATLNPALLEQILRRNPAAPCVGGESMDDFADRVIDAFEYIGSYRASGPQLVITHGWVMDVVTRQILGHPRDAVLHIKRKNGECLWVEAAPHAQGGSLRASSPPG
jgi:probable phosphoglycerate mutase